MAHPSWTSHPRVQFHSSRWAAQGCQITSPTIQLCVVAGSQVNAEIIITFEGTTESGNDFMARQSYLPNELKWGHCFSNMFSHPAPGTSQYIIDFSGYLPLSSGFLLLASQCSIPLSSAPCIPMFQCDSQFPRFKSKTQPVTCSGRLHSGCHCCMLAAHGVVCAITVHVWSQCTTLNK